MCRPWHWTLTTVRLLPLPFLPLLCLCWPPLNALILSITPPSSVTDTVLRKTMTRQCVSALSAHLLLTWSLVQKQLWHQVVVLIWLRVCTRIRPREYPAPTAVACNYSVCCVRRVKATPSGPGFQKILPWLPFYFPFIAIEQAFSDRTHRLSWPCLHHRGALPATKAREDTLNWPHTLQKENPKKTFQPFPQILPQVKNEWKLLQIPPQPSLALRHCWFAILTCTCSHTHLVFNTCSHRTRCVSTLPCFFLTKSQAAAGQNALLPDGEERIIALGEQLPGDTEHYILQLWVVYLKKGWEKNDLPFIDNGN